MTALAILGLVLFALVVVLMVAAFVRESVRAVVGLRRGTVRVRFDWDGERDPIGDSLANMEERPDALAAERRLQTPDPDTPTGWGFDASHRV